MKPEDKYFVKGMGLAYAKYSCSQESKVILVPSEYGSTYIIVPQFGVSRVLDLIQNPEGSYIPVWGITDGKPDEKRFFYLSCKHSKRLGLGTCKCLFHDTWVQYLPVPEETVEMIDKRMGWDKIKNMFSL